MRRECGMGWSIGFDESGSMGVGLDSFVSGVLRACALNG